ncbi:MAG: response regulator [Anaerolineales bacterium]|uniref:response regulator n=1 Tax=Candidatus Villigracilis affinis TaxID=3140682 RepID=UPI001E11376E|nr:response regulator [Anaerolineales bacterium]MBK9602904.1 response regulator [Anaerolineales bacterium]MBL0346076.1 response regulator [Anaerolineales bacterium]
MPEKKILIVDADVASRNFISRNLQNQKYEIIQTGSGKEGLIYAWRDRPDLMVIDPTVPDITGEEVARKLKLDARTTNMPLIALSSDPGVARIKSCLDSGFSEYITKSGQAMATLNEAINRLLGINSALVKEGGLLIVFLSAKGGAGTSSLCANLAMTLCQNQPEARVAVVDLVLPIGSISSIVGYEGEINIVNAADLPEEKITPEYFRDQLADTNIWRFNLLAGSPDPESSNHLKVGRIWNVIAALKASYDYVLIDIGRALSKISLPLIQHADLISLIISTDISALPLTKTVLNYMKNKSVDSNSIFPILNRSVGLEGLSKPDVEKTLEIQIKAAMPYLGSSFAFATSHHQPFSLKYPNDTASFVFLETAREMIALAHKLRTEHEKK